MTTLRVLPYDFTMATTEKLPLGFDATSLLGPGDVITDVVSVLTDTNTGKVVALVDDPTIDGNVVIQPVDGTVLDASHTYSLNVTFSANASTTWTMTQKLTVPF